MQDKLTSNENHVEVLERFMRTMGFGNLSDVARYFSVKPQAVSLWKANAKIPFKRLIVMLDILESREDRMYESGYINVPAEKGVIPIISLADAGSRIMDDDAITDEYVSRPHGLKGDAMAVRITSDAESMLPSLRPNMLCVFTPNIEPVNHDIVVVRLEDGRKLIKEVQFQNNSVILKSHNPEYEDISVSKDEILEMYPVIWWRRPK